MTRPTVTQARAWRPEALSELATNWDAAAATVRANASAAGSPPGWRGRSANAASMRMGILVDDADAMACALGTAAAAARDGCNRIATARADVLARVADAHDQGFGVADDGAVAPIADHHAVRAVELTRGIGAALERLGEADADAARDIDRPFAAWDAPTASADVVADWPSMNGDRIAAQIAAMTPGQRARLVADLPSIVGNTDGVPWNMRVAANRVNIERAILDEAGTDPDARRRPRRTA
jgi:hypothetical protein